MVYGGAVGGKVGLGKLRRYEMGRNVTPLGWKAPIPDVPWFLDNGAWRAHDKGEAWPEEKWLELLMDLNDFGPGKLEQRSWWTRWPDFCVVPDIVMGGLESLAFSSSWNERLPRNFRWLLAVQDGMSVEAVADEWEWSIEESVPYSGIFVGGSSVFKKKTAEVWRRFMDERMELGILHVARIFTIQDLKWCERIGATSVDSTAFAIAGLWERRRAAQLQSFLPGLVA